MVATLIIDSERISGEFVMFDVRSLSDTSAVLSGPLFLEVGELLTLRFAAKLTVELEARVQSIAPDTQQMTVKFLTPDARLKGLLDDTTSQS